MLQFDVTVLAAINNFFKQGKTIQLITPVNRNFSAEKLGSKFIFGETINDVFFDFFLFRSRNCILLRSSQCIEYEI